MIYLRTSASCSGVGFLAARFGVGVGVELADVLEARVDEEALAAESRDEVEELLAPVAARRFALISSSPAVCLCDGRFESTAHASLLYWNVLRVIT